MIVKLVSIQDCGPPPLLLATLFNILACCFDDDDSGGDDGGGGGRFGESLKCHILCPASMVMKNVNDVMVW